MGIQLTAYASCAPLRFPVCHAVIAQPLQAAKTLEAYAQGGTTKIAAVPT